jgi:hypothetical protein
MSDRLTLHPLSCRIQAIKDLISAAVLIYESARQPKLTRTEVLALNEKPAEWCNGNSRPGSVSRRWTKATGSGTINLELISKTATWG